MANTDEKINSSPSCFPESLLLKDLSQGHLACFERRLNESRQLIRVGVDPASLCPVVWDGVTCWPFSWPNTTVFIPCMAHLNGITYDTTKSVSRMCGADAKWAAVSDYSACRPIQLPWRGGATDLTTTDNLATIHLLGYASSVAALTVGLYIFTRLKDLRCVRNTIHINMMLTYLLLALAWLISSSATMLLPDPGGPVFCTFLLFYHFFHVANFTWMFVEGFYLYLLVLKTFYVEKIKLRIYLLLGWGLPLPVTGIWALLRLAYSPRRETGPAGETLRAEPPLSCPWVAESSLNWLHRAPVLLALGINTFFLTHVMVVLVKKLRATNIQESRPWVSRGVRTLRSLLVLMPLLGTPHVLLLFAPTRGPLAIVIDYVRATVLSTQGLVVTIIYCFLNTEVQESISNHVERWKSTRDVPFTSCGSHSLQHMDNVRVNTSITMPVLETTIGETVQMRSLDVSNSTGEATEVGARCDPEEDGLEEDALPVFPPVFPTVSHTPKVCLV
ncbi:diuretic hormone receptor-like [Panulirus ornatus]|uniref:diuretic hormone receptor-like n=1 Tax=Panulirus ornatus TaxID=150431 RepID=UPI003A84B4A8